MIYGNSELTYTLYRSAGTDISLEFPWTIVNDNSPLLGYNSPSTSDVSGLIYIDRMIMNGKWNVVEYGSPVVPSWMAAKLHVNGVAVMLQSAVTNDGTSPVDRLRKCRSAFSVGVSRFIAAYSATASRQKASECVYAVYEGNETEGDR